MSEIRYQISEASNCLHVEAYVLRYWEDELGIVIPRNDMGHREYSKHHIQMFQKILSMKEEGYQLKAIRAALKEDIKKAEELNCKNEKKSEEKPKEIVSMSAEANEMTSSEKMEKFQTIMTQIVAQALASNNGKLSRQLAKQVETQVVKNINQTLISQEERQEARFRKLDEAIRVHQRMNNIESEVAATKSPIVKLRKKHRKNIFRRRSI